VNSIQGHCTLNLSNRTSKARTVAMFIDVNSVPGLLYRVVVGDVADVSEVPIASIFRVEVFRLVSCCVYRTL
jgi:hypothetical protein